jgi:hypothetical protein
MSDEELSDRVDDPDDERAVAAFLDTLGPVLRDPAVWVEPPPGLGESIVAAIAAERGAEAAPAPLLTAVPAAAPAGPAGSPTRRRRSSRAMWWVAAAAAAALVALIVGVVLTQDEGTEEGGLRLAGTELAPGAEATADVSELDAGVAITLDIHDLPPAPDGFYYQGWVRSPETEPVSVGTFHMRGGDGTVTLWSGVDLATHPVLTITLQREGGGAESSGKAVLRGSLVS